mgnify:CR=1 FL=1|tara:strand:+ start:106 stop:522 length:417 start_codon:yes stop_codon:yes gene_type:complete
MKELRDVAKIYKDKALQAINPGVPYGKYKTGSSRAYKTGKMYKSIASSNRIQTMFRKDKKSGKISFTFNFSAPDYAKYVQYGTKYMKARPFAQIAAQSPEFIKAKNNLLAKEAELLLDGIFENLDEMWANGGDNLSVS